MEYSNNDINKNEIVEKLNLLNNKLFNQINNLQNMMEKNLQTIKDLEKSINILNDDVEYLTNKNEKYFNEINDEQKKLKEKLQAIELFKTKPLEKIVEKTNDKKILEKTINNFKTSEIPVKKIASPFKKLFKFDSYTMLET